MSYAGRVAVPLGTPTIGLEVRLIAGVPVLFTERGEMVRGQREVSVTTAVNGPVSARLDVLLERPQESEKPHGPTIEAVRDMSRRGRL